MATGTIPTNYISAPNANTIMFSTGQFIYTKDLGTVTVQAGSYIDISHTMPFTPVGFDNVMVTLKSDSTSPDIGSVSAVYLTGSILGATFKVRVFNNGSGARSPGALVTVYGRWQ